MTYFNGLRQNHNKKFKNTCNVNLTDMACFK